MFTGIITHTGTVKKIAKSGDWLFTLAVPHFTQNMNPGASVAVSGACLTIVGRDAGGFTVQVSKETLENTTLGNWKAGRRVNLERALRVGDELGGHFVTGHVDGVSVLKKRKKTGDSWRLDFKAPKNLVRFIAKKGSVTLDGVSLTVNAVAGREFSVNIIPHTLASTTLGECKEGDEVNMEIDVIARTLARLGA